MVPHEVMSKKADNDFIGEFGPAKIELFCGLFCYPFFVCVCVCLNRY